MTEANERAVKQVLQILRRFKGQARRAILRKVKRILGDWTHEGDNNEVISRVYITRYDCKLARLAAA